MKNIILKDGQTLVEYIDINSKELENKKINILGSEELNKYKKVNTNSIYASEGYIIKIKNDTYILFTYPQPKNSSTLNENDRIYEISYIAKNYSLIYNHPDEKNDLETITLDSRKIIPHI